MAKLDKEIVHLLEYELHHYHQYKIQLGALANRKCIHGIDEKPITSVYIDRIERFCAIVEQLANELPRKKYDFINQVYFHRMYSISAYAIQNYMDNSTAYRWRNAFLADLAEELGY
jgi:hypothetical protein